MTPKSSVSLRPPRVVVSVWSSGGTCQVSKEKLMAALTARFDISNSLTESSQSDLCSRASSSIWEPSLP